MLAPLAFRFVDAPTQMEGEFAVTVGVGFTVTVAVAVAVHPEAEAPVIVYEVVTVGLAVTVDPVVALRPVAGLHVYVLAPLAESEADLPTQIVAELTATVGVGFTVTVEVAVAVQPAAEAPVIVYTVVVVGLAVTLVPVVPLNPVDGLQVYELAPDAVNVVEAFLQIVAEFTVTVGLGFTVTVEVAVAVQPAAEVPVIV